MMAVALPLSLLQSPHHRRPLDWSDRTCPWWHSADCLKSPPQSALRKFIEGIRSFSLDQTEERTHCSYNFLMRGRAGALISSLWWRVTGSEFCHGWSRLDIRKRFFTQWVFGHRNRLPGEVVRAPSLTEFRKHLGNTLGHVVWFLGMVLCRARNWTPWALKVSSNSAYSVIMQKCISEVLQNEIINLCLF